jgi:selenocysteine-specific elongation factor
MAGQVKDASHLQFTLVDCPGHSSLIRTIIGGAQIIDMIVLVIDINKGIQAQTAECIVIGEMTTKKMIVVLNKVDKIEENLRDQKIAKMKSKIESVLSTTKFKSSPIIVTSAAGGGEKVAAVTSATGKNPKVVAPAPSTSGIHELVTLIQNYVSIPERDEDGAFYFAIDHCFAIKGHGTVLTGTVLNGSVSLNTLVELPKLQLTRKVKSMQMFRKPVKIARQGDRVGLCLTNLDPKQIERGIAVSPNSVMLVSTIICMVKKVRFFSGRCKSGDKFHLSIGHSTVYASAIFFGARELGCAFDDQVANGIDEDADVDKTGGLIQKVVIGEGENDMKQNSLQISSEQGQFLSPSDLRQKSRTLNATYQEAFPTLDYSFESDFEYQDGLVGSSSKVFGQEPTQWALLQLQQPVHVPIGSLIIGSRFDLETSYSNGPVRKGKVSEQATSGDSISKCRLAFYGPIRRSLPSNGHSINDIKIYNWKRKEAEVVRLTDERGTLCFECIAWKLFQKGGDIHPFLGMTVETPNGATGVIFASFGASGKFKVRFEKGASGIGPGSRLALRFKRYIHDENKAMVQSGISFGEYTEEDAEKKVETDLPGASSVRSDKTCDDNDIVESGNKVEDVLLSKSEAKRPPTPENHSWRGGCIESVKEGTDGPSSCIAIVSGAFKKEENVKSYIGSIAWSESSSEGRLVGPYAKLGKCKISFSIPASHFTAGERVDVLTSISHP